MDKDGVAEHLKSRGSISLSQAQLPVFLDLCSRQVDETEVSSRQLGGEAMSLLALQGHLVAHMEELCLFVLPAPVDEEGDSDAHASVHVGNWEALDTDDKMSTRSSLVFSDRGPNPQTIASDEEAVANPQAE